MWEVGSSGYVIFSWAFTDGVECEVFLKHLCKHQVWRVLHG